MSNIDKFYDRANALLDRLEKILPQSEQPAGLNGAVAMRWSRRGEQAWLQPVEYISQIQLQDLKCIDRQKSLITGNTRQFVNDLPANNVLLWGPRGTGKSSLIKAILNQYQSDGLRLVEVERQHLTELPEIYRQLRGLSGKFIIFCDDLSFESNDPSYKTLKVTLDGSVSATPDNVLIYATSNRRHLMPEYMSENRQSRMLEGELHLSEAIEEKLSLSERFGLWLAFHPFNQAQYLRIIEHWLARLQAPVEDSEAVQKAALRWALEHGSRSGRSAWQFARDWTGKKRLAQQ